MEDSGSNETLVLLLILVAFPLVFGMMWCGVLFLLSHLSGWRRLAERYRASGQSGGHEFRWQSGYVGAVSYRNCLNVRVGPSGVSLALVRPLHVFHPDLQIPWAALSNPQSMKVLWHESTRFDVGTPKVTTIRLPKTVVEAWKR